MVENSRRPIAMNHTLFMKTTFVLIFAALGFIPAMSWAGSKEAPKAPWLVTYHDGSANAYRFWKDEDGKEAQFDYAPVQPKDSSTGMYSGGNPKKGTLSQKQERAIWQRIKKLEADSSIRAEDRMKGTGAFRLKEGSGSRDFIINNSKQLEDWNQFLSVFRSGKQGLISPDA